MASLDSAIMNLFQKILTSDFISARNLDKVAQMFHRKRWDFVANKEAKVFVVVCHQEADGGNGDELLNP